MIDLSTRLQLIASLVPHCDIAADVGTDHGYLAAWLLENNIIRRVYATDIHAGPLERAKRTAEEADLTAGMEFHLCDGLQFPGADRADAVIVAGMGGETMISILQAAPWSWKDRSLVLQPQSKQRELFQWLSAHGIFIEEAKLCLDAGKLYCAFRAKGGNGDTATVEDLLLASHDPLLPVYLEHEVLRLERAARAMQNATRDMQSELRDIHTQLTYLNHYRKAVESW